MAKLETGVALLRVMLLGAMIGSCTTTESTLAPGTSRLTFDVSNSLIAPVTVSIDGSPYAIVTGGASMSLTVTSRSQWLTWTSAKPKDADGNMIPDDIGLVQVPLAGIYRELAIGNVINDQPYFTARIHNDTNVQVYIGVYNGQSVACAAVLPPAANGVTGFVLIGYYRLLPATEVRAYHNPGCSGAYTVWPHALLGNLTPNSGVVSLILEEAP